MNRIQLNSNAFAVAIRQFMSYLLNKEPTDDFTRKLDRLVNTIKKNKQFRKGYDSMGAVWYMDAKREGRLEGILQKSIDAAKKLLSTGLSKEQIASCLDLSIEKVEELSKEEKNS